MPIVYIKPEKQDSPGAVEAALRKLKKSVEKLGILKTLHEKEFYERPGIKRNRKLNAAKRRWKREQQANQLETRKY